MKTKSHGAYIEVKEVEHTSLHPWQMELQYILRFDYFILVALATAVLYTRVVKQTPRALPPNGPRDFTSNVCPQKLFGSGSSYLGTDTIQSPWSGGGFSECSRRYLSTKGYRECGERAVRGV